MRTALVIALCTAGCFSDHGLAIEIDVGATGAKRVALFVGGDCDAKSDNTCKTVIPPLADCSTPGTGTRYDADVALSFDDIAVQGGRATFRLAAQIVTPRAIAIAVGLADGKIVGTATLIKPEIPVDSAKVVSATLAPAEPVPAPGPNTAPTADVDRAVIWTDAASRCLEVERWRSRALTEQILISPVGDPQCRDGSTATNQGGDPVCVTAVPDCSLGTLTCTAAANRCDPTHVCVPGNLCGSKDFATIATMIKNSSPAIECEITVRSDGQICPGSPATVDISPLPRTVACTSPAIAALGQLDTLAGTGGATTATLAGVEFQVSDVGKDCGVQIKANGGTVPATATEAWGAIRQVAMRPFVVPLHVKLTRGGDKCSGGAPLMCSPTETGADPALWLCATTR
jgi:hypothetical protein